MRRLLFLLVAGLVATGCLDAPVPGLDPPFGLDGGGPRSLDQGSMPGVRVLDARGTSWSLDAAPRRPRIVVSVEQGLVLAPESVLLFTGGPDDDLIADLERPPLLRADEDRALPTAGVVDPTGAVHLTPEIALTPGAEYTVAVGAWVGLPRPLAVPLRVAGAGAGAVVTDSWPADGASGAPPELPLLALRFDDALDEPIGVSLRRADDSEEPCRLDPVPCAAIGWDGGVCLALMPDAPLRADAAYHLVVDDRLRDHTGARVGPWSAAFGTAPVAGGYPPTLLSPPCAIDELVLGPTCVLADDASVAVRVDATGPVRAFLRTPAGDASTVAPRGEARLRITGLPAAQPLPATLRLVDLGGTETRLDLALGTTPALATLSIVEVRSDPAGPEPRQEYVEVLNYGDAALDLDGCSIADRPDREGDVIGAGHVLPPGARALLVADGFDPLDPADVPVPPGVMLVRIGSSIASSGLSNAGEPLFLRDAEGRRLSAAPAMPSVGSGVCFVRSVEDPRDGGEETFLPEATGSCTPGLPDRVPQ